MLEFGKISFRSLVISKEFRKATHLFTASSFFAMETYISSSIAESLIENEINGLGLMPSRAKLGMELGVVEKTEQWARDRGAMLLGSSLGRAKEAASSESKAIQPRFKYT